jgi:hypothetical protein
MPVARNMQPKAITIEPQNPESLNL